MSCKLSVRAKQDGEVTSPGNVADHVPGFDEVRFFALQSDDAPVRSFLKVLVLVEALLRLLEDQKRKGHHAGENLPKDSDGTGREQHTAGPTSRHLTKRSHVCKTSPNHQPASTVLHSLHLVFSMCCCALWVNIAMDCSYVSLNVTRPKRSPRCG